MRRLLLFAFVGSLALAGTAGASTTIGTTPAPLALPLSGCAIPSGKTAASCNVLQVVGSGSDLQPGGMFVRSPGVVTSWHVAIGASGSATVKITPRLFRISDDGPSFSVRVARSGDTRTVPAGGGAFDVPDRIQAESGDWLGLQIDLENGKSGDAPLAVASSVAMAGIAGTPTSLASGGGFSIPKPFNSASTKLVLSAKIEPDADGDGYGDETQDLCPQRSDIQTRCLPPTIGALRFDSGEVRFTATSAGTRRLVVERAKRGRLRRGSCNTRAKRGPRCTTWKRVSSSTGKFSAGANSIRIHTESGRYRVTLVLSSPGGGKVTRTFKFTV